MPDTLLQKIQARLDAGKSGDKAVTVLEDAIRVCRDVADVLAANGQDGCANDLFDAAALMEEIVDGEEF